MTIGKPPWIDTAPATRREPGPSISDSIRAAREAGGYVGRDHPFELQIGEIVARPTAPAGEPDYVERVGVGGPLNGKIVKVPASTTIVYQANMATLPDPLDLFGEGLTGWNVAASLTTYEARRVEGAGLLVESSLWRSGQSAGGPSVGLLKSIVGALGAAYGATAS